MTPDYTYYKPLIEQAAATHGLNPVLVAAVCQTESSFRTDAFRHEQQFWVRYMAKNPKYSHLNPRRYSSSYSLGQVMWVVAVEEGLDPKLPPEHLFIPEVGLEYACRKLKRCLKWAEQFTAATEKERLLSGLAAYNGGANSSQAPPNPRNIKYALKVWSALQALA